MRLVLPLLIGLALKLALCIGAHAEEPDLFGPLIMSSLPSPDCKTISIKKTHQSEKSEWDYSVKKSKPNISACENATVKLAETGAEFWPARLKDESIDRYLARITPIASKFCRTIISQNNFTRTENDTYSCIFDDATDITPVYLSLIKRAPSDYYNQGGLCTEFPLKPRVEMANPQIFGALAGDLTENNDWSVIEGHLLKEGFLKTPTEENSLIRLIWAVLLDQDNAASDIFFPSEILSVYLGKRRASKVVEICATNDGTCRSPLLPKLVYPESGLCADLDIGP
jgi:hypothetical protein